MIQLRRDSEVQALKGDILSSGRQEDRIRSGEPICPTPRNLRIILRELSPPGFRALEVRDFGILPTLPALN